MPASRSVCSPEIGVPALPSHCEKSNPAGHWAVTANTQPHGGRQQGAVGTVVHWVAPSKGKAAAQFHMSPNTPRSLISIFM